VLGGEAIGHLPDGRVVFVRHALPGERVRAVVDDRELAALNGAFLAFAQKQKIGMPHLLTAIRRELEAKKPPAKSRTL